MFFSRATIVSALVGFGAATTHSMSASAAAAMSTGSVAAEMAAGGMVATHVVQVGGPNGSLTFSPDNVKANVGDLVQFQFHPKVSLHSNNFMRTFV
jgi:plastocyanin